MNEQSSPVDQHSSSLGRSNSNGTAAGNSYFSPPPALSLPKGGGAIKGMGEKFAANPVTGTGAMSVPIATSPGRSGFAPQLSLSYDSGAGNEIFGLGWSLSLPSITRKTDKGLPRYGDAEESDSEALASLRASVFILSGAEDLVPLLKSDGTVDETLRDGYRIRKYRPRIEGLFARIERWTKLDSGETHWRSISKDNITTLYGKTAESRIANPDDPTQIFSWLICESYDDKGNAIHYEYKAENSEGVDTAQAHERNRTPESRAVNRYLKRIKYGNRVSRLVQPDLMQADWLFEVVLDYGEHDSTDPKPDDSGVWSVRNDPFSSYRAGFEVRTYRLCQRVLMFHHFPEEAGVGEDCLVRSLDFTYSYEQNPSNFRNPIYSLLLSVKQTGYKRNPEGGYIQKSLPPLEFSYSEANIDETVREVEPASLENLPQGLDGTRYQWVDLDGEGLSGILTEQGNGWFYKRNLSPINTVKTNGSEHIEARFAPVELVASKPAIALSNGAQFLDLAGDGQLDVVALRSPTPGFYERTHDENWESFIAFKSLPNLDWDNPNLKFIDLDGDGHSDILITEDDCFVWYPSLAEDGFGAAKRVHQPWDEEQGPRVVFADSTQSIHLADMSGDGLTDIVRIRNGEVCYWPNLGYGRFGAKVTMDNAPWFDAPDIFNQRRIVLADIDGSGTTDILYLSGKGVQVYFNQSGNGWAVKRTLRHFPAIDNVASVTIIDLLGNGTACLVWSSPLLGNAQRVMRYIDLMGGQKPHLLIKTVNNLGAETVVQYAPSTKFYLQDKFAGKPWITKLPFPVHVVERVETYDQITGNRFVTLYRYHHGYYDGKEREFRGFGFVEQWDTESYSAFSAGGGTNALEEALHMPPVYTKTWFHTGVYVDRDSPSETLHERISRLFSQEYYREPTATDLEFEASLLPDTVLPLGLTLPDGTLLPQNLTPQEEHEACRSLRGQVLRQEIYSQDNSPESQHPYSVSERNYEIRWLQPRQDEQYGVFFTHQSETIDYYYERNPEDPRISHQMTLAVDGFGNVTQSAAVVYPRRNPAFPEQEKTLITYIQANFINRPDVWELYRIGVPFETRTYEITGVLGSGNTLFSLSELRDAIESASEISYEMQPSAGLLQKRLIECDRILYYKDNLTGSLPLGQVESLALPYESYKLALTPELINQVFESRVNDDILTNEGKYILQDGVWWIASGRQIFDAAQFYLPVQTIDPFDQTFTITYDKYALLVEQTEDPLKNLVLVENDYRVLQPRQITDANGNRSQAAFDALGMVVGTAVMGKQGENKGDSLEDFEPNLDEDIILEQIQNPLANPQAILGKATTRLIYDLWAYYRTKQETEDEQENGQPVVVYTLVREVHEADLAEGESTKIQHRFVYSDGFGREIQTKIQAEPGLVDDTPVEKRWVGTGWTIFNNKGKPVKQYEPFFSNTHEFEFAKQLGVSSTLFYDPLGRVVATLHPNHTYEKVVFDPWQQTTWDVNDTVDRENPQDDPDVGGFFSGLDEADYLPTWYSNRKDGQLGSAEKEAATKAAAHTNTPTVAHLDTLGRPFLTVADNGNFGKYETHVRLDIEGNQLLVTDARKNLVMANAVLVKDEQGNVVKDPQGNPLLKVSAFDMLGHQLYSDSMDAGERWMLNNVAGNPIRGWNSRGHQTRNTYDALQRPTHLFVQQENNAEILAERIVYGEAHPNAEALNLRGKAYQHYDGAGVVTSEEYDFKGNLLSSDRKLAKSYKQTVDWLPLAALTDMSEIATAASPLLESETFTTSTVYDALNRPISITTPDNSETRPIYNEANLLEQVDVRLRGAVEWTPFVTNIDYDAKGQRQLIEYGNGVRTVYTYDPLTYRLTRLHTTRVSDSVRLQDLHYTYDPVGNITEIRDEAQQTIFFNNEVVSPSTKYEYDALYQLIRADGREHAGQAANNLPEHKPEYKPHYDFNDSTRRNLPHPNDGQAMRNYSEKYEYDSVGNILTLIHQANGGSWTRRYDYAENNNRLRSTSLPGDLDNVPLPIRYEYDAHGNMTKMPHLPQIQWDFKDQMQQVDLGGGGTAYYIYDASGQRVRKVHEHNGATVEERIYLGGYEIYRKRNGNGLKLERETLHVMDDRQRIALVETKTVDTENSSETPLLAPIIRYQLGNHLGSVSLEVDVVGAVISYEEYHPYGTTAYRSGRSAAEVSLKRYRYTRKERDEESGLYYHGARYYVPWLGRWLKSDPHKENYFDISPYVFVLNNPIRITDPDGKDVYILYYTEGNSRGDELFKASAYTRKADIKNSKGFDKSKDIVIVNPIKDLAKIKGEVKKIVDSYSPQYGKTKEFSVWSHGALDGPIGTVATSADALDGKQMTVTGGWSKVDFNWKNDGEGTNANFFGCRTGVNLSSGGGGSVSEEIPGPSFAARISALSNFKNVEVAGQSSSAFPSKYTNIRVNSENGADNFVNWETNEEINFQITYMVAGTKRWDDWDLNEQNDAYEMQINKNGKTISNRFQEGQRGVFIDSERERQNEQDMTYLKRSLSGDTASTLYILRRLMGS
ncbi:MULTISPECIES: SpvB/TcaC N-terminal domain-containing protein [unclassified Coleofasciculus]|uniref:SpvB/TcaC N-terminal domain-containing protein n=1 Tax=unclassified Coleofasciculus TaxID=2692782 RepID=UPI0018800802|nr:MULTISPECIES: SpvB/TcaC N-terminal domain-containing protein [unclassified Coleofasciculus]MBE9128306.1 VCBS repeat-containing protein [Coleofasciculus sp. LEGE 07081]MBE9149868.1 VCBS repeat-containing protein [Coleofasciculus sp. LEGE 07092]